MKYLRRYIDQKTSTPQNTHLSNHYKVCKKCIGIEFGSWCQLTAEIEKIKSKKTIRQEDAGKICISEMECKEDSGLFHFIRRWSLVIGVRTSNPYLILFWIFVLWGSQTCWTCKSKYSEKISKNFRIKWHFLQQHKQILNSSFIALLYCGLAAFRKRSL